MTSDAPRPPRAEPPPDAEVAIRVTNAGMVILNGYLGLLFSRLGLIEHNTFVSEEAQRRAVHYLQFLVTDKTDTAEPYLMLNKLLCGMALNATVDLSIEVTDAERELCTHLLNAVVSHWPAIGESSADGLRSNFLVRDGVLRDDKDYWSLHVERRAYDVLLARSPYNYSIIKCPWMEKALYVTWPA